MAVYTEGMMDGESAILRGGAKMTVSEVLAELNASAGNVTCDACGNWIEPDEPVGGIECDLCEQCVRGVTQRDRARELQIEIGRAHV